jgi:hypothetical protein
MKAGYALNLFTPNEHVRFTTECVAKLGASRRLHGEVCIWTADSVAATLSGCGSMINDTELRTASSGCEWRSMTEKLG